jgi:endonuclease/exonuclease/phosphatase (EEP) superfamily protein YafD
MLTPKTPLIKSPVLGDNPAVPDLFNLLSWNIHKENYKKKFPFFIQELKASYSLDLLLLQEARFSETLPTMAGFPYIAAANLSFPRFYSGVVTATNAYPFSASHITTNARELVLQTRKSSLVTIYRFIDKLPLMIVNIHAINFKALRWYHLEFSRLYDRIRQYKGPMIIAGDFNCWGKHRKSVIKAFARSLNLEHARPESSKHIKKWFGHRLDRIYYRDLIVNDVQVINCKDISDHNPIIAGFERTGRK